MTTENSKEQSASGTSGTVILPDDADLSILQQPLNLGVKNVKQILNCVKSGSREIRDIILNECNIIYECKVCLNLFRSLANFVYHKRGFCKKHLCEDMVLFEKFEESDTETAPLNNETSVDTKSEPMQVDSKEVDHNMDSEVEKVDSLVAERRTSTSDDPVNCHNGLVKTEHEGDELQDVPNADIKNETIPSLKVPSGVDAKNAREKIRNIFSISLRPIPGNQSAVFQVQKSSSDICSNHINDSNNTAASDMYNVEESVEPSAVPKEDDVEIVTEVNGNHQSGSSSPIKGEDIHLTRRKRLLNRNDCNVQTLKCLKCNTQFTTLKTLYFHMMSIHSQKSLHLPCPFCKCLFGKMYCVTRHIIQAHGKAKEDINNKMRETIRKAGIWKKEDSTNLNDGAVEQFPIVEIKTESSPERYSSPEKETEGPPKLSPQVKVENDAMVHRCSKCERVFARRSSQVSHEKFCIMNSSSKVENIEQKPVLLPQLPPICTLPLEVKTLVDTRLSTRPKRSAEKHMHKDFIDSQTLKWRSANKLGSAKQISPSVSKQPMLLKSQERKITSMMNSEKLLCRKCGKKFSSYSNLRRHAASHIGWTRYKCKCCEYQSYNKSDCMHHIERMHPLVPEDKIEKHVINLVAAPAKAKGIAPVAGVMSEGKATLPKSKGNVKRKGRGLSLQKRKLLPQSTKKEATKVVCYNRKKKSVKSAAANKTVSSSYKSLTTNNPTTIILSKTCSSSTVQITNSVVPVSQLNSTSRASVRKADAAYSKQNKLDALSKFESVSTNRKTNVIKIRVPCQVAEKSPVESPTKGSPEKKNRTISDWFVKKESATETPSRKDSSPVIIDLIPASSANISV